MKRIIKKLKSHAQRHYETDGWDYLVECYDDDEIEDILREENATTLKEAVAAFSFLKLKNDRRKDIEATVW